MMNNTLTRRALLGRGLLTGGMLTIASPWAGRPAVADAPALDPANLTAKALGYVTQSVKAGANCENCTQYHGVTGDAQGPCAIFPGKTVTAAGWCLSWAKKPA